MQRAATPEITVGSGQVGMFTLTIASAQKSNLIVNYTLKGTAINSTDYEMLSGTAKIKAGKTSKVVKVIPQGNLEGASKKTVVMTLAPGTGYEVGTTGKLKIKILARP